MVLAQSYKENFKQMRKFIRHLVLLCFGLHKIHKSVEANNALDGSANSAAANARNYHLLQRYTLPG